MSIKSNVSANCELYVPAYPEKYVGKDKRIICRSSWEKRMCYRLDHSPAVLQWCSECVAIKYQDPLQPIDRQGCPRIKNYYPDFYVVTKDGEGNVERYIVEVKPKKETVAPRRDKRKSPRTQLYENKTWAVNKAKWLAAERFCAANHMTFKKLTEDDIFGAK